MSLMSLMSANVYFHINPPLDLWLPLQHPHIPFELTPVSFSIGATIPLIIPSAY